MPDRNLLTDVADAVASRQEVDWERCAEQAGAADRGALEHLRTFERISRATVPPSGASVSARRDGGESRLAGGLLGVLVAVALVESAVGLAGGASLPAGGHRGNAVGPRRTGASEPRLPAGGRDGAGGPRCCG